MQLTTIDTEDHALLRTKAELITYPLSLEIKTFIQDLKTFFASLASPLGKPAGLAAPQVGKSLSIIIIQVPEEAKKVRKEVYDVLPPTVLINPRFTPLVEAGNSKDWEGCYSVPQKMGEVYRYQEIDYNAFDEMGNLISGRAKGFLARLIQHEVGHLNGELYTDLLTPDCRFGETGVMMKIRKEEWS
jgi:peptide deformylase